MSAIFDALSTTSLTPENYFICLACALLCGLIVAFAVSFRNRVSKSFVISMVLLPMIVHTVITMVNGSIGTGVAVMGAFSLIRFRSVPGKARDIAAIFLAMTAGLACATGYVVIALIFTLAISLLLVLFSFLPMGDTTSELRITVPESLRYSHEFDDLFAEYTKFHRLAKVKTTNMGSLYRLTYRIKMKDPDKTQEFIDKIRCRNGNLEISVAEAYDSPEEL